MMNFTHTPALRVDWRLLALVTLALTLPAALHAEPPVPAKLLTESRPALVRYKIKSPGGDGGKGPGFFVSPDGVVLVNAHSLIHGLPNHLIGHDGEKIPVRHLLAVDSRKVLAALATGHKPKKWLPLSNEAPALGSTLWLLPPTSGQRVSSGPLLSIREQPDPTGTADFQVLSMGFHPPTRWGATGLPLLDDKGVVRASFGMMGNRAQQALSFAFPVSEFAEEIEKARRNGSRLDPALALPKLDDPAQNTNLHIEVHLLVVQGDFHAAQIKAKKLVEAFPKSVVAWMELGHIGSSLNDSATYERAMQEILKLQPTHRLAALNLGRMYISQGKLDRAEITLKKIISHAPEIASGWLSLGKCQLEAENYEDAAVSFKKGLEIAPEVIEGWDSYSLALSALRRDKEADEASEKVFELEALYRLR